MTRRTKLLFAAAALVVGGGVAAALIVALGGSSASRLTRTEYFARVAAICRVYGPQLDRIAPPSDPAIPAQVADPVQAVLPLVKAETEEVRALQPPAELADRVARWLALKDRSIETLERTLREALIPDIRSMGPDWLLFVDQNAEAAAAGGKIGFPRVCSSA
ncbi:MAG TPA: hypothetical protein VFA66_10520 [Gaiellaceae bacterium]|nr:hypothetical protein [Gaiellaceae bacterium]